jgi:predicted unusual protein kinase regulating ubiquinone biosynthesis (AarF/ABC1/UbiB family)
MDEDICDELALLQDHLDPFPTDSVLVERFGLSEPIACASVAQVAVGRLRRRRVAVKIQRPDVEALFTADLSNIRMIAKLACYLNLPGSSNMLEVVQETSPIVLGEVDFVGEAKRTTSFRRSLMDVPGVVVPRIHIASQTYIVMEYLPGIKINDTARLEAQGIDLHELSYRLMSCFLIQVLRNGHFHADPHSGNVAVDRRGNIIFYDLGASIDLDGAQDHLTEAMSAVVAKDSGALVRALTDLQVIKSIGCKSLVRKAFERFFVYVEEGDLSNFHASMANEQLFSRNNDRVFKFTASFVYLVRSLTMLEGICKVLDPTFDFETAFNQVRPLLHMAPLMQPMEMLRSAISTPQTLKSLSSNVVEQEEVLDVALSRLKELDRKQSGTQLLLALVFALSVWHLVP